MKKVCVCVLLAFFAAQLRAEEWMTDLNAALAKAKQEKKIVLMDFTGSDWCPPCKKLRSTVLDSTVFKEYAAENLVLVEVDFPRSKPQSKELKAANEKLQAKYKIEGFPTIILLDADGKQLSSEVGYGGTSPKEYIKKIEGVIKSAKK